jgi:hypothetical protein
VWSDKLTTPLESRRNEPHHIQLQMDAAQNCLHLELQFNESRVEWKESRTIQLPARGKIGEIAERKGSSTSNSKERKMIQ